MTGRNTMAALALAAALSGGALAQTPSDQDAAQRFAGAWRLVSWTERLADGTARQAATDVGYLEGFVTYTEDLDINPRTVGTVRKRWFAFDGPDRLKLTIDAAERQANLQDSSLIWERVRSK